MDWVYNYISVSTFWTILLIVHMLLAVTLLGAITHQAATTFSSAPSAQQADGFLRRFSSVRGAGYTNAVCTLWVLTYILGGFIYTKYRIAIRIPMEQEGYWKTVGVFELKENLASVVLMILPFYWYLWKHAETAAYDSARRWTTVVIAAIVWYMFLAGHIVNNVRGFGS
jgi:hypothetical protein